MFPRAESPPIPGTAVLAAASLLAVPRRLFGTVSQMTNGTSQYSAEGENSRMDKDVTSPPHFTLHSPMTNPPSLSLLRLALHRSKHTAPGAGLPWTKGRLLGSGPLGRPHVSLKRLFFFFSPPPDPLNSAQRGALIVTGGIGDTRRGEPMN